MVSKIIGMTCEHRGFMDDCPTEEVNRTVWTAVVMTVVPANIPCLQSNDWPNRNLHNTWRSVGHLLLRRWISYGFYQTAKLSQLRVGAGIPSCNWIVSEFRPGGIPPADWRKFAKPLAELDHTTFLSHYRRYYRSIAIRSYLSTYSTPLK